MAKVFLCHTLPETNSSPMKIPLFPGKYHQNGGFSVAMLVSGRVNIFSYIHLPYQTRCDDMAHFVELFSNHSAVP